MEDIFREKKFNNLNFHIHCYETLRKEGAYTVERDAL